MLDIYLPGEGVGPFPVIVFIHGGAFAVGDKTDEQLRPWLGASDKGFALVSVNYRLSGEAIFPAALQDVKAAIRYLKANAVQYRLDTGRVAVCGDSTGGYYAAMVCLTAGRSEFEDPSLGNDRYSCSVNAAVDWYGPTDFSRINEQLGESNLGTGHHSYADSPESRLLGACVAETPSLVWKANPVNNVHKACRPCSYSTVARTQSCRAGSPGCSRKRLRLRPLLCL